MSDESKAPKAEKFDFLGLFKMFAAGKEGLDAKIIIKDMSQPTKHTTIQARNDMSIDVHEKNEATNEHTSLGRTWLTPDLMERFGQMIMEFAKSLVPIEIASDAYKDLVVFPIQSGETVQPKIKKKTMVFDTIPQLEACKLSDTAQMKDGVFLIKNEGDAEQFMIYKINGTYFKVPLSLEGLMKQFDEMFRFGE